MNSLIKLCLLLSLAPVHAQTAPRLTPEGSAVAKAAQHLSLPYALYVYDSASRETLDAVEIYDPTDKTAPSDAKMVFQAKDRRTALEGNPEEEDPRMRRKGMEEWLRGDGDAEKWGGVKPEEVPKVFAGCASYYLNEKTFWPSQAVPTDNAYKRYLHLAGWQCFEILIRVANESHDEIADKLLGKDRKGDSQAFDLNPEAFAEILNDPKGSLLDTLKNRGVLSQAEYDLLHVTGPSIPVRRDKTLALPPWMQKWKQRIDSAYGIN